MRCVSSCCSGRVPSSRSGHGSHCLLDRASRRLFIVAVALTVAAASAGQSDVDSTATTRSPAPAA